MKEDTKHFVLTQELDVLAVMVRERGGGGKTFPPFKRGCNIFSSWGIANDFGPAIFRFCSYKNYQFW